MKTKPPIRNITESTFQQGCIIHTPESAQAIISIAKALEENAKALTILAKSVGQVPNTFTEPMVVM